MVKASRKINPGKKIKSTTCPFMYVHFNEEKRIAFVVPNTDL
jgi:hypothetical protein